MNSSSNAMQRKYFYAGHDHFLPVAIHPTAVTSSLYIQLLTFYIPVLSIRTNFISIYNSVSSRYTALIFHIHRTVISDSLLLLLSSYFFQIIPVSSNSPLGMWGMLVLTFINKVPTVISFCGAAVTGILWRMFREMDTDNLFSFSWGFWSGRFQTPISQSVLTHLAYKTLHSVMCSIFRALSWCTNFVKMTNKCTLILWMNVNLLYSYHCWSLCNKCCIHETKAHFLVLFIIFLHYSLCLFPACINMLLQC